MRRRRVYLSGALSVRVLVPVLALAGALLVVWAVVPASAQAADLFPIDNWIGGGLRKLGGVVLGGLQIGAKEIARLLATVVVALADLLVPKSFVRAGLGAIRWLVQLPPVGTPVDANGVAGVVRMPHLQQLRSTLTWIGVTLLPLGLTIGGARAFLAPAMDADSPSELLGRAVIGGLGLLVYDWGWGVVTRLVALITDALLGLPWVADGVRRMLQALLIGGAGGTAVAAEFVVPLVITGAGMALLGLLLIRVGLEVAAALVYVSGGLALGVSVTGVGRRLLTAWVIAATAIVVLPILWALVFVTGAALMLDTGPAGAHGFAALVGQLFNVAAALAVFWLAMKVGLGVFRQATGAITSLGAHTPRGATAGSTRSGPGGPGGRVARATPMRLAAMSQALRGGMRTTAMATVRAAGYPVRHPVTAARAAATAARHPVQSTRSAADRLTNAIGTMGAPRAAQPNGRAGASGGSGTDRYGSGEQARASGGPAAEQRDPRSGQDRESPGTGRRGRRARRAPGRGGGSPRGGAAARRPVSGVPGRLVRLTGPRPWWWGRTRRARRDDDKRKEGR